MQALGVWIRHIPRAIADAVLHRHRPRAPGAQTRTAPSRDPHSSDAYSGGTTRATESRAPTATPAPANPSHHGHAHFARDSTMPPRSPTTPAKSNLPAFTIATARSTTLGDRTLSGGELFFGFDTSTPVRDPLHVAHDPVNFLRQHDFEPTVTEQAFQKVPMGDVAGVMPISAMAHPNPEEAQWLRSMHTIRIVVPLQGGRHGPQAAAFTLMQSLRERGFTGTFDIVFETPKVGSPRPIHANLFPQSSNVTSSVITVTHPQLGIVQYRKMSEKDALDPHERVDLTLSAERDTPFAGGSPAEQYRTQYYAQIQPTQWRNPGKYPLGIWRHHATDIALPASVINHGILSVLPSPDAGHAAPATHAAAGPSITDRLQSLVSAAQQKHNCDVFFMYGLNAEWCDSGGLLPEQEMRCFVAAIRDMQQRRREAGLPARSVLVVTPDLLTDFRPGHEGDMRPGEHYDVLDVQKSPEAMTQLEAWLTQHAAPDVRVISTGALPRPVFDALAAQAQLCVGEGANFLTQCALSGKPFIPGGRYGTTAILRTLPEPQGHLAAEHHEAAARALTCASFEDSAREKALSDFLVLHAEGRTADYFRMIQARTLDMPDILGTTLRMIRDDMAESTA